VVALTQAELAYCTCFSGRGLLLAAAAASTVLCLPPGPPCARPCLRLRLRGRKFPGVASVSTLKQHLLHTY
jgi:hypothetical protein